MQFTFPDIVWEALKGCHTHRRIQRDIEVNKLLEKVRKSRTRGLDWKIVVNDSVGKFVGTCEQRTTI